MLDKHLKAINKRGYYFHNAISIPLSEKYNLTPNIINWIREQTIFRKRDRTDICLRITNALESNSYFTSKSKPKDYSSIEDLVKSRQKTLHFLLRCSQEDFQEITRLTKYDWDYKGEDKILPSKKEYLKYLKSKQDSGR